MFLRRACSLSLLRSAVPHVSSRSVTFQTPRRDIRYLMNDVYDYPKEYQRMGYTEANGDMIETVINEVGRFAEEKLDKLRQIGDSVGAKFDSTNADVTTPPGFKEAYHQYREGGWQALAIPTEYGGMGMPDSLNLVKQEILATSNWSWSMYPGLSVGCMNTLLHHGSEDQKKAVLPHLGSGVWTGTMCLTEPHCGTDLAQCKTRAVPTQEVGLAGMKKYKVTGTKIFISCGEHDMSENIIHIVLARLPDAPKGTKGISLFLIPKYNILDMDGSVDNSKKNVVCGGIEEKMGIHGSSTCVINFENSEGYLIGKENEGLMQMFTFMNAARLGTALQGVTAAELSYQGSLPYAKERTSMRSLSGTKAPEKDADPIIFHPDVRRMLLIQRAFAEGGRCMMYHLSLLADKSMNKNIPEAERKEADQILGLLTPIAKGFLTEVGCESTNHGMQIYGGHGFIRQWGMEQLVRDARISTLYEGTTTIQSLDLIGRKVLLDRGKVLSNYVGQLCRQSLSFESGIDFLGMRYQAIRYNLKWQTITLKKMVQAAKNRDSVGSGSVDYLMFSGYVCLANYWLQMATISQKKLRQLKKPVVDEREEAFHKAKIATAQFYFDHVLPRAAGLEGSILADPTNLMSIKDDDFHFF